ncbi:von Willebrand factor type D domain protein [Ectocarpus siliculosus]|uniref:von Willebrand factor type D domain protein n=1 Tax=Ectocarpus siliculosus TaxID=2880 RepID=D7FXY5_ECTSI|nr:von Willebrand factor type D domain protein [Ectocarpus siliculosus]|eukprot:CBJ32398.1 von Willebrand factor type D domain protein [Ectocarpus siliculosus]
MATEPTLLWSWQDGTSGTDNLYGVAAVGGDDSFVLAGRTQGDWAETNEGDFDFMAVKFAQDGTEQWRLQAGTPETDTFHDAAAVTSSPSTVANMAATGTSAAGDESTAIILAGFTKGGWDGAASAGGSDFVAVSVASGDGSQLWSWQDGTEEDDVLMGVVERGGGSAVVLAGRTGGDWADANAGEGTDFAAVKLEAGDGSEIWRFQDGSSGDDTLKSVAAAEDDTVVLAGYTEGSLGGDNAGETDCAVVKLDADGGVLWRWQGGTAESDVCSAAAVAEDGSIVVAGYTVGSWGGSEANAGEDDLVVVKLDKDGNELWHWQEGTPLKDRLFAAALCEDGGFVLAGYSEGDWAAADAGAGGSDLIAVKLSPEGEVLWRWQDGNAGSDWVTAAASTGSGGSIVLAGTSEATWQDSATTTTTGDDTTGLTTEDFVAISLDVAEADVDATRAPVPALPPTSPDNVAGLTSGGSSVMAMPLPFSSPALGGGAGGSHGAPLFFGLAVAVAVHLARRVSASLFF